MKNLVNVGIFLVILWAIFGQKSDLLDIIKPEPLVIEVTKPEKFVDETSKIKEMVPESARLDLLVFNDEFSKKLKTYDVDKLTSQIVVGDLYPRAFKEAFDSRHKGKLSDLLDFKKSFIQNNISPANKYLTQEELNAISEFYKATAWNLTP